MKDVAVVMDLHDLAPVGGRATSGREGRRLERFAEVCEDLTSRGRSHPGLLPLANLRFEVSRLLPAVSWQPDVAAATGALERKLLPHPRDQLEIAWVGCPQGRMAVPKTRHTSAGLVRPSRTSEPACMNIGVMPLSIAIR